MSHLLLIRRHVIGIFFFFISFIFFVAMFTIYLLPPKKKKRHKMREICPRVTTLISCHLLSQSPSPFFVRFLFLPVTVVSNCPVFLHNVHCIADCDMFLNKSYVLCPPIPIMSMLVLVELHVVLFLYSCQCCGLDQ